MELGHRIQHYRKERNWSQEELAERLFVSRQSISNWERGKTYPDLDRLLALAQVFDSSVDDLLKGDLQEMKEIVHGADYAGYTRDSKAMLVCILLTICLGVPATLYLGWWGFALLIGIGAIAMFYALRIEAFKKRHDIQTYRELLAYDQQQALTSEQKIAERAKRPYQKFVLALLSALIGAILALIIAGLCRWLFPIS